jgi:hypothetical protein
MPYEKRAMSLIKARKSSKRRKNIYRFIIHLYSQKGSYYPFPLSVHSSYLSVIVEIRKSKTMMQYLHGNGDSVRVTGLII